MNAMPGHSTGQAMANYDDNASLQTTTTAASASAPQKCFRNGGNGQRRRRSPGDDDGLGTPQCMTHFCS